MIYLPEKFAYLLLCAPFVLVYFVILLNNTIHRRDQLRMTILGAILGPLLEVFYFRDFWFPKSSYFIQIGQFPLMIEDVIFGAVACGIMSVLFDVLFEHNRYEVEVYTKKSRSLLLVFGTYVLSLFFFLVVDLNSVYASAIAMFLSGLVVLYFRRDLYVNAFVSAFGFAFIVFMSTVVFTVIVANIDEIMRNSWLIYGTKLDVRFVRVPVAVLAWAFGSGFFIGPLYKFVNNLGYYFDNGESSTG